MVQRHLGGHLITYHTNYTHYYPYYPTIPLLPTDRYYPQGYGYQGGFLKECRVQEVQGTRVQGSLYCRYKPLHTLLYTPVPSILVMTLHSRNLLGKLPTYPLLVLILIGSMGLVQRVLQWESREYRGYKGIHVLLVSTSTTNTYYKLPIPLYPILCMDRYLHPGSTSRRGWWADTRYTQVYREYMVLVVRGQQDYSIYGYRGNTPRNTLLLVLQALYSLYLRVITPGGPLVRDTWEYW